MIKDKFACYEIVWSNGVKTQVYLSDASYESLVEAMISHESVIEIGGSAFSVAGIKSIVNQSHQAVLVEEIIKEGDRRKFKKKVDGRATKELTLREEAAIRDAKHAAETESAEADTD